MSFVIVSLKGGTSHDSSSEQNVDLIDSKNRQRLKHDRKGEAGSLSLLPSIVIVMQTRPSSLTTTSAGLGRLLSLSVVRVSQWKLRQSYLFAFSSLALFKSIDMLLTLSEFDAIFDA